MAQHSGLILPGIQPKFGNVHSCLRCGPGSGSPGLYCSLSQILAPHSHGPDGALGGEVSQPTSHRTGERQQEHGSQDSSCISEPLPFKCPCRHVQGRRKRDYGRGAELSCPDFQGPLGLVSSGWPVWTDSSLLPLHWPRTECPAAHSVLSAP